MRQPDLLRQQLKKRLEDAGLSQRSLAARIRVTPQTLNDLLTGKKHLVGATLESALEVLEVRLALLPVEHDPDQVFGRALYYAQGLFPQAGLPKLLAFDSSVAWLCTGNPKGLMRTLRALAVQDQLSPILSFEQAVVAALPLVFAGLTEAHRRVVDQDLEGDDRWDQQQIEIWRLKRQVSRG